MFELSQSFYFESAHTLRRRVGDAAEEAGSRRIHGHTYQAEVVLAGTPDAESGMLVDLAIVRAAVARLRERLDHHLLDEVPGLGLPTLERLCVFIFDALKAELPQAVEVSVWRERSGDRCTYRP
ncbi:6-carboxytetrahydropterin synthase [Piscinibacter sp. Jin2]|uniref:6-carboxy-5,6,7,8-tetrahydropterin synthase n=2 Tax=Aquariibacter TaxID=2884326 RepID=A0A839HSL1_9BURK|nr:MULTISPECIES: 6-carboxytetrahydropterin synthase [Burkholderiales]MBB1162151.1 6-carboxytetrahydropterin synthase [Aquariibacter albus]MBL0718981.1 6-carboxytetrahydropterin synthase [Piscinibacter lacus]